MTFFTISECNITKFARLLYVSAAQEEADLRVRLYHSPDGDSIHWMSCCQRGYKADAAIIPEPTGMKVLAATRASLCGKITVVGRAGHAEMTQPHWTEGGSVNAISKAVKIIGALEDNRSMESQVSIPG